MNAPSPIDRETFLNRLQATGLLAVDEYERALSLLPASVDNGKKLARFLVDQSVLTRFQAERILANLTQGFILGQYRVLDLIGKGGMGRVYKAEHRTMRRVVAVKVLSAKLTRTERIKDLFLREVRASARLHHPNVVTAFDANEHDGRCYLVMEYIDGPNLHQMVKRYGALPVGLACDVIRQACDGLRFAHDQGFVHRDIKPANFLLQPTADKARPGDFLVKILDFGLARIGAPGTTPKSGVTNEDDSIFASPWTVNGTPDFLSPEQSSDVHSADVRSDIYSLGCTFYFMLAGRVPFPGGNLMDKLVKHRSVMPEHVETLRPEVPGSISAIVRRMMAKEPHHRYQSADAVIDALANVHEYADVEAVSVGSWTDFSIDPTSAPTKNDSQIIEGLSPWTDLRSDEEDVIVSTSRTQTVAGGSTGVLRSGSRKHEAAVPGRRGRLLVLMLMLLLGVLLGVAGTLGVLFALGRL